MTRSLLCFTLSLLLWGCATAPTPDTAQSPATTREETPATRTIPPEKLAAQQAARKPKTVAMTFGRGIAQAPVPLTFMVNVSVFENDSVEGSFSYSATSTSGSLDIEAQVQCTALDHDAGKAWVGGKLTRNGSTDPRYTAEIGSDVWIHLLDRNLDSLPPMVSAPTMRSATVRSAADFCKRRPWSDEELYIVEAGALAIFP